MSRQQVEQEVQAAGRAARAIAARTGKVVVGRDHAVRLALLGLLGGGHCLFEDNPGLAKTLLVKTLARTAGVGFKRIQFTPDLMPADVTGSAVFDMKEQRFRTRKGPIFTNVLLGDELNRAPPKTQAALLEGMQERQVTLDGTSHALPDPFIVYATQNPIESEGVYVLPEAEMDRFMLRIRMGYPGEDDEVEVMQRVEAWAGREPELVPVLDAAGLRRVQAATHRVVVHADLKRYMVRLAQATRNDPNVLAGSSPRGGIALMQASKAQALLSGRAFATEDDVRPLAEAALAHRIVLDPDAEARGVRQEDIVQAALTAVPTPSVPRVAR